MLGKWFLFGVLALVYSCGHRDDDEALDKPTMAESQTGDKSGKPTIVEKQPTPGKEPTTSGGGQAPATAGTSSTTGASTQGGGGTNNSPDPNVNGDPALIVSLASEPFLVSDLRQARLMNKLKVDTQAPAKVVKIFLLRPERNGFLDFDYEHKSMRDCHGGLTFDYKVTVRDMTTPSSGSERSVALRSCFPVSAQHQYHIEVAITNSRSCDSVGLEIGMVAQFACRE